MIENWDEIYLSNLITNEVEENLNLEYKGAESLGKSDGKKKEISKDVSAFANSDGGIILYGMKEFDDLPKRHLPEKIDVINRIEYSKEWLEQIVNSNIYPRISNILIKPIRIGQDSDKVVYAIEIPKSSTAHQSNDKRYYKRFNFESVAMYDYEIKDILNRSQNPIIDIELKILIEEYRPTSFSDTFPDVNLLLGSKKQENKEIKKTTKLFVYAYNSGRVFVSYLNCFVDVPEDLIIELGLEPKYKNIVEIEGIRYKRIYCDNTTRDIVDTKGSGLYSTTIYGPSRFEPILPKTRSKLNMIPLNNINNMESFSQEIFWSVYADNAEPIEDKIKINEIVVEKVSLKE